MFRYLSINLIDHGQVTKNLEIQEFSFLSLRHRLIRSAHLWNFIKLSCTVRKLLWFSVKLYGDFHELIRRLEISSNRMLYGCIKMYILNTFWPHYISPTCESVSEKCNHFWTIQDNLMKLHRWTQPIKTRVVGKNEYNCSFSFLVICPLSKLIIGT